MTDKAVAMSWLTTRLLTALMLFTYASRVIGDVNYYRGALEAMHSVGLAHTLVEYPLPAVAVVGVPWLLSAGGGAEVYFWIFLFFALATDAVFTWALQRAGESNRAGVLAWLLVVPALGAVTLARFDLLPGVLVGLMVLLYDRQPRAAASALAVATCVKLWPAILIPSLLAATRRRRRRAVTATVGAVGAAAVAAILTLAGLARLLSPLRYQGNRGLQVESVAATPAMIMRWLRPGTTHVWYAPSKAWEITGPGVDALLTLTTVASAVFVVGLLVTWYRGFVTRRPLDSDGLVWLTAASTTAFIVLGRVLSPQYLLWLGPVCAAGLVVTRTRRRTLVRWTAGLVATAILTHLVFPVTYTGLHADTRPTLAALTFLVLRNVAMVWLLVVATRMAWRSVAAAATEDAGDAEAQTALDVAAHAGLGNPAGTRA